MGEKRKKRKEGEGRRRRAGGWWCRGRRGRGGKERRREGGWRCRWRWVLRGHVGNDAGGENNDGAGQTVMQGGDRGESVPGGGLMEMRGAATVCVWELLRESGREMKMEDCGKGSRGVLR
ncbi:hypothetical protein MRB53_028032 [Persea americana]|uniref:Uncharacterized protein n=1 Tax=Persea americana TaxID=3435 RepID=A0ACC2KEK9_PERAE|nr:hypothetical protein MRB53_028032 [Persea americana]